MTLSGIKPMPTPWPSDPEHDWKRHGPLLYADAYYSLKEARVRLVVTFDGDQALVEYDCEPPPVNHWLSYEQDAIGLPWALFGDDGASFVATWLLEHGIAPGQPFWIEASYWSAKTWTDYGYEHDAGVDWAVTSVAPWATDRTIGAWCEASEHLGWACDLSDSMPCLPRGPCAP